MDRENLENTLYAMKNENPEMYAEILIEGMFRAINGSGSIVKKKFLDMFFKEHRYLQSEMFGMFYELCLEIENKTKEENGKARWFDGRNEHIINLAEKMIK